MGTQFSGNISCFFFCGGMVGGRGVGGGEGLEKTSNNSKNICIYIHNLSYIWSIAVYLLLHRQYLDCMF